MNTRRLRYLVAVADCGSFTRAAEQLHIEQPPLTQQIRALERELGIILFVRSSKGAVPTEAGTIIIERARVLLELEKEIYAIASSLARGERGQLRIGMAGAVSMLSLVPSAIEIFRKEWPDIGVTLEESNTMALCQALHMHKIDVAILRGPVTDRSIGLRPLVDERAVIVLPKGHSLQCRPTIRLSDVADCPLIIFERDLAPGFYDAIIAACEQSGFFPRLGARVTQLCSIIPMVAAGLGVGIVPAYLERMQINGVSFHAIDGPAPQSKIILALREDKTSVMIARFQKILIDLSTRFTFVEVYRSVSQINVQSAVIESHSFQRRR